MPVFDGLGKALRWLRARQDKRQYQVADTAGITKAMLSAYETGKQKPSLETLDKILAALGSDLADLHEALSIVNERRGRRAHPAGWGGGRGERAGGAPAVDVYRELGIDEPLAPAEEQALEEMLTGFHRLIRHFHGKLRDTAPGD